MALRTRPLHGPDRLSNIGLYLIVAFFMAAAFLAFYTIATNEPEEDEREIRRFGKLECVYNVVEDEVESCVEVER